MSRDVHVRFCESRGVRFPPATHLVVLTTSRQRAEKARHRIEEVLAGLGLRLHPDKTRIVCLKGGEDGFDFLGFHHRKTPAKWGDRRYLSKWPSPRAMNSIRSKVRDHTHRRFALRDLHDVAGDLNPVLRGWGAYCVPRGHARSDRRRWILMT